MESAPEVPTETNSDSKIRPHGVLENYFASNAYGASYVGFNFAVATPVSEHVELIFAGQTGTGDAPGRFEATSRVRVNDRHRVGVTASGVRFATLFGLTSPTISSIFTGKSRCAPSMSGSCATAS
jgi:hypothetical protein